MKYFQRLIAGGALFAMAGLAQAVVVVNLEDATNGGGFFGVVTFTNGVANTVSVSADISPPINAGLTQGDILGLWFDFADIGSLSGDPCAPSPTSPLECVFAEDAVGSQPFSAMNTNINGAGADNWDLAVEVGENGSDGGFNQMITFDLVMTGLTESQFVGQRVGMRVQSIEGGSFDDVGSSKLLNGGQVPEPATIGILGLGLLGLGVIRRKRRI